jgi:hypothetical protein
LSVARVLLATAAAPAFACSMRDARRATLAS